MHISPVSGTPFLSVLIREYRGLGCDSPMIAESRIAVHLLRTLNWIKKMPRVGIGNNYQPINGNNGILPYPYIADGVLRSLETMRVIGSQLSQSEG